MRAEMCGKVGGAGGIGRWGEGDGGGFIGVRGQVSTVLASVKHTMPDRSPIPTL